MGDSAAAGPSASRAVRDRFAAEEQSAAVQVASLAAAPDRRAAPGTAATSVHASIPDRPARHRRPASRLPLPTSTKAGEIVAPHKLPTVPPTISVPLRAEALPRIIATPAEPSAKSVAP